MFAFLMVQVHSNIKFCYIFQISLSEVIIAAMPEGPFSLNCTDTYTWFIFIKQL